MYWAIAIGSRLQTRIARAWSDCSNSGGKLGFGFGNVGRAIAEPSPLIRGKLRIKPWTADLQRCVDAAKIAFGHISNPQLVQRCCDVFVIGPVFLPPCRLVGVNAEHALVVIETQRDRFPVAGLGL